MVILYRFLVGAGIVIGIILVFMLGVLVIGTLVDKIQDKAKAKKILEATIWTIGFLFLSYILGTIFFPV